MSRGLGVALALACALATSPAVAEGGGKTKAKAPFGQQIRYFDLSASIFSELGAQAILKETRQGTIIIAAELEVCHQVEPGSDRLDRFVVPLKVEGQRLLGTAQSQEDKLAVSVNLVRRIQGGGKYAYEGSVGNGKYLQKVASTDNPEMSEQDFMEQFGSEETLDAAPTDFTKAAPQSLIVQVDRPDLTKLLNALRDQHVRVVFGGLAISCRVLKDGYYTVQVDLDAERAGAVLARLKSMPGVQAAGYLAGDQNMHRALRFPSASWRNAAGALNRDRLAAALGAAAAKTLSGALASVSWDNLMGELTLAVKRPDDTVSGLKLTRVTIIKLMVSPETPARGSNSILWIDSVTTQIIDERPPPRLEFLVVAPDDSSDEQQSGESDVSGALAEEFAGVLNGTAWDTDTGRWSK